MTSQASHVGPFIVVSLALHALFSAALIALTRVQVF